MQSLTNRTRGDLVRYKGRHAMVAEIDRRHNTATLQFGASGPFLDDVSWWDMLPGNDDTAMHVHGCKLIHVAPIERSVRVLQAKMALG